MIPPTETSVWQAPVGSAPSGPSVGELMRQLRDEERY
jgi:hypothetical protein